jgi:hypothetical protein
VSICTKNFKLSRHSTIPLSPNIVWNNEPIHCTIEHIHSTSLRFCSRILSTLLFLTFILLSTPHFTSLRFYHLHFAPLFLTLFLTPYVLPVRFPIVRSTRMYGCLSKLVVQESHARDLGRLGIQGCSWNVEVYVHPVLIFRNNISWRLSHTDTFCVSPPPTAFCNDSRFSRNWGR